MRQPTSIILFVCSLLSGLAPAAFAQSAFSQVKTQKGPIISAPIIPKKRTGDLDTLLPARVIRISVPYSKTLYYTVKGVQYGIAYETGKAFEAYLNKKYPQKSKSLKILVIFMVTSREKASQLLNDGFTDILVGSVAITPNARRLSTFRSPPSLALMRLLSPARNARFSPPSTIFRARKYLLASLPVTGNTWSV